MARSKARTALAFVLIGVPALAACNSIIGLSDFNKGDCPGGGACLDEAGVDSGNGGTDSGSPEGGNPDAGRGAAEVSWATWVMPNYKDASAGSHTTPELSLTSGATVTDGRTHLVWQQTPAPTLFTYDAATAACKALADGPWRLPKRIELITLLDYSRPSSPFIDTSFFTGFPGAKVWTSSEYRVVDDDNVASVTSQFWTVNFDVGDLGVTDASNASNVALALCVKGTK